MSPQEVSETNIDIQKEIFNFNDGIKSKAIFYRSVTETIQTAKGRRYPEPRPTIIFFHGFRANKDKNTNFLIAFAHMGYLTIGFDQRGHGEAGGKKSEWYKLYTDIESLLDFISTFDDVKKGALCCIGKSMGGTSVLTKCYSDNRVAMVIGISTLHSIESILNAKFRFLSAGWFVRRIMSKVKNEKALQITAHFYLRSDPEYNKNRVYLIHGKKDSVFPYAITFELNKKQAKIPENQAVLLNNAGHSMKNQEILVFSIILKWILDNKSMNFSRKSVIQ
ncbi:MAG: alpha/beta hydrolase [Candidatus Hermodarchaeota archaeon]